MLFEVKFDCTKPRSLCSISRELPVEWERFDGEISDFAVVWTFLERQNRKNATATGSNVIVFRYFAVLYVLTDPSSLGMSNKNE